MYVPCLDLSSLSAIDMHVHVEADENGRTSLPRNLLDASASYFRSTDNRTPTVDDLAERYRAQGMAAVVFTVEAQTATGHDGLSSEAIADRAAAHADVLIPFGSVDPLKPGAVERATRLVEGHGVRGFKFHPSLQGFAPNEERFRPLWAVLEELGLPVIFHTGANGIGAGLPGGSGLKLRFSHPLLLDEVAAEFPGLLVVMAHAALPWADEAISVATHKANVFFDLSGWTPKRWPANLVRAIGSQLQGKALFGSDYPLITPERWVAEFATLDVPDGARSRILKTNAAKLLGLAGEAPVGDPAYARRS